MLNDKPSLRRWYVATILMLAYSLSFLDRTVLNLLVTDIKSSLGFSDVQISLLQGPAFVVFYVVFGLIIARLADVGSRRSIILIGMTLWCAATAANAWAFSFATLFALRSVVGIGEASLTPSATSMLTDLFSRDRLGSALRVYGMGPFIGGSMALVIGSFILDALHATDGLVLLGSRFAPWEGTFLLVGAVGLVIPLLIFTTIKEPPRHRSTAEVVDGDESPALKDVIRYFGLHWRAYLPLIVGFALFGTVTFGVGAWLPTFFIRRFDLTYSYIGENIGLYSLIGGLSGVLAGGFLVDRIRAIRPDAPLIIGACSMVLFGAFQIAVVTLEDPAFALAMLIPATFFSALPFGGVMTGIQLITPNRMRARIVAVWLFIDALLGMGLGPTVTAMFTDYVFRDEMKIGYSIISLIGLLGPLVVVIMWSGMGSYRRLRDGLDRAVA